MTANSDFRLSVHAGRRALVLLGLSLGFIVAIGTLGLLQSQSLAAPPGGAALVELAEQWTASPAEKEEPGTGGPSLVLPPWFELRVAAVTDAAWPLVWTDLVTDTDDCGPNTTHRNVLSTYYAIDNDYLYLRMETETDAGWQTSGATPLQQALYKWWFDTAPVSASVGGNLVYNAEYLMMLEDVTDNPTNTLGARDALGELTFMDDLDNVGFSARWDSGRLYLNNTPDEGNPAGSSPYWMRVYGDGTPGKGGPQSSGMSDAIGYSIISNTVDMYVSWAALGYPLSLCVLWATDSHNTNLDQSPDCDAPIDTYCLGLEDLPYGWVTVIKETVPPGQDQDVEFTSTFTGPFNLNAAFDYSITVKGVPTGTHEVTETVPEWFTLSSIVCDDPTGGSSTDPVSGTATIGVDSADHVICTFTNKLPTVTLTKTVVNDDGGHAVVADFQAFLDGGAVAWDVEHVVVSGTHTVSETPLFGYAPSAWGGDCDADGTFTVTRPGEYTCTITNDDIAPTIALSKTVVNDHGGLAVVTDFQAWLDGGTVDWFSPYEVVSGSHSVSETTLFGYTPSAWGGDCDAGGQIAVEIGISYTCTITNDDIAPTITLSKTVVNDDGGDAVAADFQAWIDGSTVDWFSPTDVVSGSHGVSETPLFGYTPSAWGGDCDAGGGITVEIGNSYTCTISNDDIAPTLWLSKTVTNSFGGTATVDDFQAYVDGEEVPWGETQTLMAGSRLVTETMLSGYRGNDWVGDCDADGSITLEVGGKYTCTIINEDIAPTITLFKTVVNDGGGGAVAGDFQAWLDGSTVDWFSPNDVVSGSHSVSETTLSGYAASAWGGDCDAEGNLTVELGGSYTCTITNDDISEPVVGGIVSPPNPWALLVPLLGLVGLVAAAVSGAAVLLARRRVG